MSEKPKATLAELEARLAERLRMPIPRAKPEPPPPADVIEFDPWGPRRPWSAEPAGTVNAIPYEPTALDRLVEVQRAVAAAARADRLARDPFGIGLYGAETIDDVVRRQDEDR